MYFNHQAHWLSLLLLPSLVAAADPDVDSEPELFPGGHCTMMYPNNYRLFVKPEVEGQYKPEVPNGRFFQCLYDSPETLLKTRGGTFVEFECPIGYVQPVGPGLVIGSHFCRTERVKLEENDPDWPGRLNQHGEPALYDKRVKCVGVKVCRFNVAYPFTLTYFFSAAPARELARFYPSSYPSYNISWHLTCCIRGCFASREAKDVDECDEC